MLEKNVNVINHIAKFYAAYEIVLEGPITFDEIKRRLIKNGIPETSARRYVSEFRCPFCADLLKQDDEGRVIIRLAVYCIIEVQKVAKQKWRMLHLHFGENCNCS